MILFLIPIVFGLLVWWLIRAKNKKIPTILIVSFVFLGTFASPFVAFNQKDDDRIIHTKFINDREKESVDNLYKSPENDKSTMTLQQIKSSADQRTNEALSNNPKK